MTAAVQRILSSDIGQRLVFIAEVLKQGETPDIDQQRLSRAELETLRKIAHMLAQAMAATAQSMEAQVGLISLTKSVTSLAQNLGRYSAGSSRIEAKEIHENARDVQQGISDTLHRLSGMKDDNGLRQTLLSSLQQLKDLEPKGKEGARIVRLVTLRGDKAPVAPILGDKSVAEGKTVGAKIIPFTRPTPQSGRGAESVFPSQPSPLSRPSTVGRGAMLSLVKTDLKQGAIPVKETVSKVDLSSKTTTSFSSADQKSVPLPLIVQKNNQASEVKGEVASINIKTPVSGPAQPDIKAGTTGTLSIDTGAKTVEVRSAATNVAVADRKGEVTSHPATNTTVNPTANQTVVTPSVSATSNPAVNPTVTQTVSAPASVATVSIVPASTAPVSTVPVSVVVAVKGAQATVENKVDTPTVVGAKTADGKISPVSGVESKAVIAATEGTALEGKTAASAAPVVPVVSKTLEGKIDPVSLDQKDVPAAAKVSTVAPPVVREEVQSALPIQSTAAPAVVLQERAQVVENTQGIKDTAPVTTSRVGSSVESKAVPDQQQSPSQVAVSTTSYNAQQGIVQAVQVVDSVKQSGTQPQQETRIEKASSTSFSATSPQVPQTQTPQAVAQSQQEVRVEMAASAHFAAAPLPVLQVGTPEGVPASVVPSPVGSSVIEQQTTQTFSFDNTTVHAAPASVPSSAAPATQVTPVDLGPQTPTDKMPASTGTDAMAQQKPQTSSFNGTIASESALQPASHNNQTAHNNQAVPNTENFAVRDTAYVQPEQTFKASEPTTARPEGLVTTLSNQATDLQTSRPDLNAFAQRVSATERVQPIERHEVHAEKSNGNLGAHQNYHDKTSDGHKARESFTARTSDAVKGAVIETRSRIENVIRSQPVQSFFQAPQEAVKDIVKLFKKAATGACAGCNGGNCATCTRGNLNASQVNNIKEALKAKFG